MQGHINPALQFAECIIRMGVHFKRNGSKALTDLIVATANKQCIVYTMLLHWVASVARDLHIPSTLLWIQPAMVLYIYYHYYNDLPNYNYRICHLLFATHDLPSFLLASNHYALVHHILQAQLEALENESNPRVLVNTFDALELKAFKALKKLNLVAIGPLSKSLVICISFGSLLVLNKQQMEEIAHGLLDCGRPFLWVIRAKESAFPHRFDQATNAKLIKDVWKTRVRVTVNKNGIVEGDEIKRCLELVVGDGERGKAIRRNAKKWKELAMEAANKVGSSSYNNLKAFVDEIGEEIKITREK
ncbi:hypothetical protein ACB098_02G040700 [Castanea mollissima]